MDPGDALIIMSLVVFYGGVGLGMFFLVRSLRRRFNRRA